MGSKLERASTQTHERTGSKEKRRAVIWVRTTLSALAEQVRRIAVAPSPVFSPERNRARAHAPQWAA
jgi:hypothetical protein